MTNPTLWNQILIWPILNLLIAIYKAYSLILLPGAFGFAIITLTLLIRVIVSPLTKTQLKSAQKMSQLKPKLDELTKKHKEDKVKLQQAQMQLYKDAGVNPAAGCLPTLVQIPLFIALYSVFGLVLGSKAGSPVLTDASRAALIESINKILYHPALHINKLDLSFFGLNLASRPNEWKAIGIGLLLIPVVTGLLQYLQTKMMLPASKPKQPGEEEDQMVAMQKQMGLIMPVMIGYFAFSFPIGLALYWNTFTLFGIMQQLQLNRKSTAITLR